MKPIKGFSILLLSIISLCLILAFFTGCNNAIAQTTTDSTGTDPGSSSAMDLTLIIGALITVYEVGARLWKTRKNLSIIDLIYAIIDAIIPNRRKTK